jgi:hypothetical protein
MLSSTLVQKLQGPVIVSCPHHTFSAQLPLVGCILLPTGFPSTSGCSPFYNKYYVTSPAITHR